MSRSFLPLLLLPLLFLAGPLQAAQDPAAAPQNAPATSRPVVLVRILALDGTGPDLKEHRLFTSKEGFVTTLDALGRVGYQVSGKGLGEGGYHTLFAQLADEYELVRADGARMKRRFSDDNKNTRVRVRGMVLIKGGQASPLGMLEDPSYYGSRRDTRRGYGDDDD
jgi:hypothetical protein